MPASVRLFRVFHALLNLLEP